jgi:hypothetical protein
MTRTIKTWRERLFDDQPELRNKYPEDCGALDEIGCWHKDDEIAELREYLAQLEAAHADDLAFIAAAPERTKAQFLAAERAGVSFSTQQKCWNAWFGVSTKPPAFPPTAPVCHAPAVEWYSAVDGVEHSHPEYGQGVFFTLDCVRPAAAPEAAHAQQDAAQPDGDPWTLGFEAGKRVGAQLAAVSPSDATGKATNAGGLPRIPTEAMLNAARDWSVKKFGMGVGNDGATGCWQAMYDAAVQSPATSAADATGKAGELVAAMRDRVAHIRYIDESSRKLLIQAADFIERISAADAMDAERECQYPHESAECKGCGWTDRAAIAASQKGTS